MKKKKWIIFIIVIIIYLFIVSSSFSKSHDDENVYFYMGKLVAEGNIPYKDFFLSHPPLQIFLFGLIFKIFGFKLLLFKIVSVIATVVSAIVFFKLCNKKYSLLVSFFSIIIFLFSHETLITSTTNLGINIALMFVIIGMYMLFMKKYVSVKIDKGNIKFNLTNLRNYILGFFISFVLISLILIFITKGLYFFDVFKYHLIKKPFEQSALVKLDLFKKMFMFNPFIFIGLILYFFKRKKVSLMFYTSLVYILFLLLLKNIFPYYFIMVFPFLAILTSVLIVDILKKNKFKKIIYAVIIFLFLISTFNSISYFIVREQIIFKNNEDDNISNLIKETSKQNDLIFGDYLITPLIALKSDRKIALNFVDTHYLRFTAGLIDIKQLVNDLKQENLKYFLITKNNIMYSYKEFNQYLNESCYLRGNINLNVPTHFTKETIIYQLRIYDCGEGS